MLFIILKYGELQFPRAPITVPTGVAFFLPFNMKVGEAEFVWADESYDYAR